MEVRESYRFADYFVACGISRSLDLTDAKATPGNPLTSRYKGEILDRYPLNNYEDAPLPPHVWMFTFPPGVTLRSSPTSPTFFIFALTELDGARFYGASLTYYEPLPDSLQQKLPVISTEEKITYYAPTCLCILSHYPFYSIFREMLRHLYTLTHSGYTLNVPLERIIANFVIDVPLPIPGVSRVRITLPGTDTILNLSRPPKKYFNIADFSFSYIFQSLGVSQVIQLFLCILCERKVIFTSSQYTLLTIAAESITYLMYPFYWHHVYIPILPISLNDFLQAPTPFIMGLHTDYYREPVDLTDIVIVDLDKGTMKLQNPPPAPPKETAALNARLRQILTPDITNLDLAFPKESQSANGTSPSKHKLDTEIRIAFMGFFVSLFPDYRNYMSFLRRYPQPIAIFHKARYLKLRPDSVQFLSDFLETQAFAVFLEKHHQSGPNNFDDATFSYVSTHPSTTAPTLPSSPPPVSPRTDEKDKSRYSHLWDSLAFLSAQRAKIRDTVEVIPPDSTGLPPDVNYTYNDFPKLKPELFPLNPTPPPVIPYVPSQSPARARSPSSPQLPFKVDEDSHKTEEEESAEEFVQRWLDVLFSNEKVPVPIDSTQKTLLYDLFRLSHVRAVFADRLLLQKSSGKTVLQDWAFEILVDMVRAVLVEANKNADFRSPSILMSLAATYFTLAKGLPEFLQNRLRDLEIWKNSHFWEASFFEAVETERKTLPEKVRHGVHDWDLLKNDERMDVLHDEENIIFSVLGSYAYHMLNLGVDAQTASMFIARTCSLSLLTDDHTATLHALVENINRVCSLTTERVSEDEAEKRRQLSNGRRMDYFTSSVSKSLAERGEARELYQRIIECKRSGPGLQSDRPMTPLSPLSGDEGRPGSSGGFYPDQPPEPSVTTERREGYSVTKLKANRGGIDSMILHQNLGVIVCGSTTGPVAVWSIDEHSLITSLEGHEDRVTCLSSDGKSLHFASGSHDKTVRVWGVKEDGSWAQTHAFSDHNGSVTCAELRGNYVISGSYDNSLKVFDLRSGKCEGSLTGHTGGVMCVQFDDVANEFKDGASDGLGTANFPYIVSGSRDTTVRLWDARTLRSVHTLTEHTDWVKRVQFDSDKIVSGSYDCTIKIWDPTSGKCHRTLSGHVGSINHFQYTDKILASASGDGTLKIWDLETGNCTRTLKGHTDEVVCMKLAGNKLVSGSSDHSVRMWDLAAGKCERTLRGHSDWVYSLDVQGNHIYSASWDGSLRIWEIDDPMLKKPLNTSSANLGVPKGTSGASSPVPTPRSAVPTPTPAPSKTKKLFSKKF
eukprot:Phypoly_transcript_00800.p1 GENE.Phypoly_transcript_00800~~Phypoly_transcript_00800.p1  ORF type:complete len:1292 (+),score=205.60 Phypoly_transcript_00800:90-3965(+)